MTEQPHWRNLKDSDLNWYILQQMGWVLKETEEAWGKVSHWVDIVSPDGERSGMVVMNDGSRIVRLESRRHWFHCDLNAAFALLKQMPLGAVFIEEDGVTWSSNSYMDGAGILSDQSADTPEYAICYAWLEFKERK